MTIQLEGKKITSIKLIRKGFYQKYSYLWVKTSIWRNQVKNHSHFQTRHSVQCGGKNWTKDAKYNYHVNTLMPHLSVMNTNKVIWLPLHHSFVWPWIQDWLCPKINVNPNLKTTHHPVTGFIYLCSIPLEIVKVSYWVIEIFFTICPVIFVPLV